MKPKQDRRPEERKPLNETKLAGRTRLGGTATEPTPEEKELMKRRTHSDLTNDRNREPDLDEKNR